MRNIKFLKFVAGVNVCLVLFTQTTFAATYSVNSLADNAGDGVCDATCTLREAVNIVNAGAGGDTIDLSSAPAGTIGLTSPVEINQPNTSISGSLEVSMVNIIPMPPSYLLTLNSNENVIDGLVIYGENPVRPSAIHIIGDDNIIKNSFIDANSAGTAHRGSALGSIEVSGSGNQIGVAGEGNTIGGQIYIAGGSNNVIAGNYIGVSETGENISIANANGITVSGDAVDSVVIGQAGEGGRNVIGNFGVVDGLKTGIVLENGSNVDRTVTINNNYIGVKSDGVSPASNLLGISVSGNGRVEIGASDIDNPDNRNVIAANYNGGVGIKDEFAGTVLVNGNYIGLGADGETIPYSQASGVNVRGGGFVYIGASLVDDDGDLVVDERDDGDRNVISGNGVGVEVTSASTAAVTIKNNYVGLNSSGDVAVGNEHSGISLFQPAHIYNNVVSGNQYKGIMVNVGADGTDIYGNYIGLSKDGTDVDLGDGFLLGNGEDGIAVEATGVIIGDPILGGNVISGNALGGIGVRDTGSATIKSNIIGRNVANTLSIPNGDVFTGANYGGGIMVSGPAVIGGSGVGEGNIVSGNIGQGILVATGDVVDIKGNVILGNTEGADAGALSKGDGIVVTDGGGLDVGNVTIGGEEVGDGNVIGENEGHGIQVLHYDGGAGGGLGIGGLSIFGNYIGTNLVDAELGNSLDGIYVYDMENSGLITGLTIGSLDGPNTIYNNQNGIYNYLLSAGVEGFLNSIDYNIISNNIVAGITNVGASPSITNNTILNNGDSGILSLVDYGDDLTPAGFVDDVLSEPMIVGNTFDYNGLSNNTSDIEFVDTIPVNATTLYEDNTFGVNSSMRIAQVWYGAVEVLNSLYESITAGVVVTVNPGMEGFEKVFDTYSEAYGELGAWGSEGFDYNDITTWSYVVDYVVDSTGLLVDFSPDTISAVVDSPAGTYTDTYSFSGQAHEETAIGLEVDTDGRYQIAEVLAVEVAPVCGNSEVEEGEECDDGNALAEDGCSATCQNEGGSGGGTLIVLPPSNPQPNDPSEDVLTGDEEEEVIQVPTVQVIEEEAEESVNTVEGIIEDIVIGTEAGAENEITAEVRTEAKVIETKETETKETETLFPTQISSVDTEAVYGSSSYAGEALSLILDDKEECSGARANECLKQVYGLDKIEQKKSEEIIEKELGDAVVFNKKPGEIITVPRIVNLHGIVGSNPVILVLSKPNENVTIELVKESGKMIKKQSTPIILVAGQTDDEGKAVLNTRLSDGNYSATIYTTRNGHRTVGKTVQFKVDQMIDQEFRIEDLEITEENAHEVYAGEAGDLVEFLLTYIEKFSSGFVVNEYIEYSRTGGKVYIAEGRVDTTDNENKMVYIAYQSVTFGSVVVSDASQKGSFKIRVPNGLGSGQHKLTAYAYDPKQAKATSQKKVIFQIQK